MQEDKDKEKQTEESFLKTSKELENRLVELLDDYLEAMKTISNKCTGKYLVAGEVKMFGVFTVVDPTSGIFNRATILLQPDNVEGMVDTLDETIMQLEMDLRSNCTELDAHKTKH